MNVKLLVMGVSGCGKTTAARAIATALDCTAGEATEPVAMQCESVLHWLAISPYSSALS
ncbi:AAA family ATPase [Variovorax sp. M-6]|uniref:AAA family ATPase n=1 Tax=Variovorax sp. M-6 TaxID=3233041 RepID=UPI003F95CABA